MRKRVLGVIFLLAVICVPGRISYAMGMDAEYENPGPVVGQNANPSIDPNVNGQYSIDESNMNNGMVSLSQTDLVQAIGTTAALQVINNGVTLSATTYTSSNPAVASVDGNGTISFIAQGNAVISCTVTAQSGAVHTYNCYITVTCPQFTSATYFIDVNGSVYPGINGTSSVPVYTISDPNVAALEAGGAIHGLNNGQAVLSATVDGVTITTQIVVSSPKANTDVILLQKNKTSTIVVTGQSGLTPVVFSSENSNVATVSANGKVRSKKYGSTYINIQVDERTIQVCVSIGPKRAIRAVKKAQSVIGATYSQSRRMQKGYYDCSSLVWRSYKPYKVYFGDKKYAPTASNQAKYMVSKKLAIAYNGIDQSALRPGDVLYFSRGANGRYKNIYHTAIYLGCGRLIHADGHKVSYGSYDYYQNKVVVIARPVRK